MFDFLFKKNKAEDAPIETEEGIAPGTNIRFDPKLVSELKSDHQKLVKLFTELVSIAGQRDSQLLTKNLSNFGSLLRGHILKENVRLYVYLKSSLQADEDSLGIMQGFSQEMNQPTDLRSSHPAHLYSLHDG